MGRMLLDLFQLFAEKVARAEEEDFDRGFGAAKDFGDLGDVHVFDIAQP